MRVFKTELPWSRWVIALAGVILLVACSSFKSLENFLLPDAQLRTLTLQADKDVNAGYPIAVDVLLITDQKVYDALNNLKATEWFSGKLDYLRQHQNKLFLNSWELVPGQKIEAADLVVPGDSVVGALIFADYLGDRTYRASVVKQRAAVLHLGKEDFELLPYDAASGPKTK